MIKSEKGHLRIVNGCHLCRKDEETVHHLLNYCRLVPRVRIIFIKMFDVDWIMPKTVEDFFLQWRLGFKFPRGKILCTLDYPLPGGSYIHALRKGWYWWSDSGL